jgi:hypothetical protein
MSFDQMFAEDPIQCRKHRFARRGGLNLVEQGFEQRQSRVDGRAGQSHDARDAAIDEAGHARAALGRSGEGL